MRNLGIKPIKNLTTANAFIFGLIFNQNQKAERAWNAPYLLKDRLSTLNTYEIIHMPLEKIHKAVIEYPALHPFSLRMARHLKMACEILAFEYMGDARNIWKKNQSANDVFDRLKKFPGIGEHKAKVGIFLMKNELNITLNFENIKFSLSNFCPNLEKNYLEVMNEG